MRYLLSLTLIGFSITAAKAQPISRLDPVDAQNGIFFGWSVAIDPNQTLLAVSAPSAASPGVTAGRVDLYDASGTGWSYSTTLTAEDGVVGDDFGSSIAFSLTESGTYLLIGARDHDAAGIDEGAIYVFAEASGGWEQVDKLLPPDPDIGDAFGRSLDADGSRFIAGAHYWNAGTGSDVGAAYVYEFDGDTFVLDATLTAEVTEADFFGQSVALSGDWAFVGAYRDGTDDAASAGTVFAFERVDSNEWASRQQIAADLPESGAGFGISVDAATLDAPTIAVGAYRHDDERGSVYVFRYEEIEWVQQTAIQASDAASGDWFGSSVALTRNPAIAGRGILAVGARRKDLGADQRVGSAYRFDGVSSDWGETTRLQPEDIGGFSEVGYSVAVTADYVVAGAPYTPEANQVGAAYSIFYGEAENRPPVARLDWGFGTSEDPVLINVLANDSDPDGDELEVTSVGNAEVGTLEIVDNRVIYYPDDGAEGDDRFSYVVQDGRGGSAEGLVEVRLANPTTIMFVSTGEQQGSGDPEVFRTRRGTINSEWMFDQQASEIGVLVLNLFDDVALVAERVRVEQTGETSYSWFGVGPRRGDQIMLDIDVQRRVVLGTLWINGFPYSIRHIEGELYRISEINSAAFIDELSQEEGGRNEDDVRGFDLVDGSFMDAPFDPLTTAKEQTSNIDLLIFYTTQAADSAGSQAAIKAQIRNAVDLTNQTFVNSAIDARVRLVGTGQLQYAETGDSQTDLDNLQSDGQSSGSDIYERRRDTQADIVGLVVGDFGDCGRAFVMEEVGIEHREKAYFVVEEGNCLGANLSFGHEIGHILGARHDRNVDNTDGSPFDYNHGYVNPPSTWSSTNDQWRTVMAYMDRCTNWTAPFTFSPLVDTDGDPWCGRQMIWSDPDSLWNGSTRGIASGSNAADNVRALNNTVSTAAAFMSSEPSISGYVTDAATGQPMNDVAILVSDGQFIYVDSTDSQGFYVLFPTLVFPGATSLTVTPELDDYVFEPESRSFSNFNDDQSGDFTGFELLNAEGQVVFLPTGAPLSGIEMRGVTGVDETTDASGMYSFELPWGWSGRIAPYSREYHFAPEALVINSLERDTTLDFVAERNRYTISGTIQELDGTPVAAVELQGYPDPVVTNSGGYYEIELEHGWEGTVTPVKSGYNFEPFDRDYSLTMDRDDDYDAYPGVLARSAWPAFGANARNTAAVTASTVQDQIGWSARLNGRIAPPVVAADGTAIVGTDDGWLIGFGPQGVRRWELDPTNFVSITASPVVGTGGLVYIAESDASGRLTALSYVDRSVQWTFATGAPIVASPTIGSLGQIYVGTLDGNLLTMNSDGSRSSTVSVGGPIYSSPARIGENVIYFGSDDGKLYAYEGGVRQWTFTTGDKVRSGPTVASDGTIYFGSDDDHVYAVGPNGTEQWRVQTGGNVRSSPAIDSQGNIYLGSEDSLLYALDPTGQTLWTYKATAPISGSPAISQIKVRRFTQQLDEEILYFADDFGNLHALNLIALSPSSDRLKWRYLGAAPFGSSGPVITGNGLLIGSQENLGLVTKFEPQSRAWTQGIVLIQDAVLTEREVAIAIWMAERGGPLGIIGGLPDEDPCRGGPLVIPDCPFTGGGAFGDISPYVLLEANRDLVVGLIDATADIDAVVSGESTEGLLGTFPITFEDGEVKALALSGLLEPERFLDNPDGRSTALNLYPLPYFASQPEDLEQVAVAAGHFSTDAGELRITMEGPAQEAFAGLRYGETSEARSIPPGVYDVSIELVESTGKRSTVTNETLDLSGKAGEVVSVLATGFVDPEANMGGPQLGLVAAGTDEAVQPVAISEKTPELPDGVQVLEAYPDPFSEQTTIRYSLPDAEHVRVEVFDVGGRRVRTLVNELQRAGEQSIVFERGGLSSGLYFYRILTKFGAASGRMIVVK